MDIGDKSDTGEAYKKDMDGWGKDVIFKYKPIVSVPDYDNDNNSKKKERKYKQFIYRKAKMKNYFILF